ncbi:hypothetical protein LTR78_007099 [Recurvomyces mirabilis]|uniref:Sushi domain-containing protein n=1 Tax=Recurvomyces mirabilis TaxID=574656 RepID=A0AAE0WJT1_9PEZI|nr:hypothetical protein LTR78_007099 [Recurvomyces mirabilis]KAK5150930.1 hypothetical protein LTS14_009733 [Recurvomyces mirabilis]
MKTRSTLCSAAALTAVSARFVEAAGSIAHLPPQNTTALGPESIHVVTPMVPEQTLMSLLASTTTNTQNTTSVISSATQSSTTDSPAQAYRHHNESNGVETGSPAVSKAIEVFLWTFSALPALTLLINGRLEGLIILLLLSVSTASASSISRPTFTVTEYATITVTTTDTPTTTTPSPLTTPPPPPPTAVHATFDEKKVCYQNVNGLLFPTPCITYDVMITVHGPAQPGSPPGPVCWSDGTELPCNYVHSGAKENRQVSSAAIQVILATALTVWLGRRALGLMVLVLMAMINGEASTVPSPSAISTVMESATVTVTVTGIAIPATDITVLTTPPPTTALPAFDEKDVVCYQTVNGLAYQTPCQTFNVWTAVEAPGQSGPVCQEGGTVLPCVDTGMLHSRARNERIIPSVLGLLAMVGGVVLVLGPRGVWILPFALLLMGLLGLADATTSLSEPTITGTGTGTSTALVPYANTVPDLPIFTTAIPNATTTDEKAPGCYYSSAGLLLPSPCPAGIPAPQPPLGPGQCMRNGLVYDCTETYMTPSGAPSNQLVGASGALLGISLLVAHQDVLSIEMLIGLWISGMGGFGVAAQVMSQEHVETPMTTVVPTATKADRIAGPVVLANACPTMYGMQACPLPAPSEPVVRSAASRFSGSIIFQTVSQVAAHALESEAMYLLILAAYAIPTRRALAPHLLATRATIARAQSLSQARHLPGLTSIPLPELAVNTSTIASVTVTETSFIKWTGAQFTPTVTHFIAVCTPYCASVNDNGQCQQVEGLSLVGWSWAEGNHNILDTTVHVEERFEHYANAAYNGDFSQ